MLFYFLAVMAAKEKPPMNVVGDVGGRIAIIVVRTCLIFGQKDGEMFFFLSNQSHMKCSLVLTTSKRTFGIK